LDKTSEIGGKAAVGVKTPAMPDLDAILLRKSVGALSSGRTHCSSCRRTPLVGERLHETDGGRQLCDLCVLDMPVDDRHFVRVERIHASERHLHVAPHIAA
jgi:hypothetical protein